MWKSSKIRTALRYSRRRLLRKVTVSEITDSISFLYPPPDGGWGWIVVLSAVVHSLLVSGFHNSFGVYMLSLLETFKSNNSTIAWIGSVSYAFIMIFGPVSGKLLVKYGAIKVAIIGTLVVMIGLICSSYAYDLRVLFLTHGILVGVGSSLTNTPGLIMVSLYFTTKRSFATGLVMAGACAGTLIQNNLHQYLIQTLGWRASLRIYSGIFSVSILAGFAYKPLQKHRAHPSVVEKFQTSPLKGFIVDLSLWKDRIFEVWVCSLGLAKFGFFIPFVHMFKLAGDLGIPTDKASYIMVGIGLSSMISCLLFGKLCDIERINRLYLNQASILSVGVVYFIIPYCTNFASLVAICSVLGFFDAGNYVLLPVLTFDLMGAEKMTLAWGFMMAVNAISCFGPPFAGWMYDLFGNYNIGFMVTGVCNVAAASILAFIPWLQRSAKQARINYLNASVCEVTNTILPWQSSSSSLGSVTSSDLKYSTVTSEESSSEHSKKMSARSLKSILKSEVTSFKSAFSQRSASIRRKKDGVSSLSVEGPGTDQHEQVESTKDRSTDLRPAEDLAEAAYFKSEKELSEEQKEHMASPPHRKEDGVAFLDVERSDSDLHEQVYLRPVFGDNITKFESATSLSVTKPEHVTLPPHRKEDGVAFLDIEDDDSDEEEQLENASDVRPMEDQAKSRTVHHKSETSRHKKQTEQIPHRKEDGVAFLDVEDTDSDQEQVESTAYPRPMEYQAKSGKARFKSETSRHKKQTEHIPHRKEDGVAFFDIEDYDSDQEEEMEDQAESEIASAGNESSASLKCTCIPCRKDGVTYSDAEGNSEQPQQQE